MTTTITRPASEKQIAFARRLITERVTTWTVDQFDAILGSHGMTTKQASAFIDSMMKAPKAAGASAAPGYYVTDEGDFVVVVENKAKTRTYAKALSGSEGEDGKVRWSWAYAPGVAASVASSHPMTIEEAAAFGHLHGVCIICCRPLTDPKSVTAGIGPVCAKRIRG